MTIKNVFIFITTGECIAQPKLCTKGLSVGLQIEFDENNEQNDNLQFIFDSGAYSGEGVSVYRHLGKYFFEVADGKERWKVRIVTFLSKSRSSFLQIVIKHYNVSILLLF